MAVPTKTTTLNNFATSTAEHRRKDVVDNFFGSAPMWAIMRQKNNIVLTGGTEIHENFIYSNFAAGSYGRGTTFDSSTKEFSTKMIFDWKFCHSPVNIDVIDAELNESSERVFNLVEAAMEVGELSLIDDLSTQLYGDGSGNGSLDINGLEDGISQSGSYGGITRTTTAKTPGLAIRSAQDDTTGGALSLSGMQVIHGNCVVGKEAPDMISTTQTLWNKIWERSQPSERNNSETMRDIGFRAVALNAADVVVDSHNPSGVQYYINTNWWNLYSHRNWSFVFRGFMEPATQQKKIGQLIWWGNAICRAPRFQGKQASVT